MLYRLLKLIAFYLAFYLLLGLIGFIVVFYQPTVVVNCILDRLPSLAGVSCNLANRISPRPTFHLGLQPRPTIKYTGEF